MLVLYRDTNTALGINLFFLRVKMKKKTTILRSLLSYRLALIRTWQDTHRI